jgi:hypothetical protein
VEYVGLVRESKLVHVVVMVDLIASTCVGFLQLSGVRGQENPAAVPGNKRVSHRARIADGASRPRLLRLLLDALIDRRPPEAELGLELLVFGHQLSVLQR